jgi:hypothetical protein
MDSRFTRAEYIEAGIRDSGTGIRKSALQPLSPRDSHISARMDNRIEQSTTS